MSDDVLLLDIGPSAGDLPSATPAGVAYGSWFPTPHQAAPVPAVDGVIPTPVADGVLIEWDAVDQQGVIYVIERGPTIAGPWTEVARVTDTRYLYSDGSGLAWFFKVTATVRGRPGVGTIVDEAPKPVPTVNDLVLLQQQLDSEVDALRQADIDGALAAAEDATAKANAARDAALAQVDALAAEVAEIAGAPSWEAGVTYAAGWLVKFAGGLYRAKVETTGNQPDTSPTQWEKLGDYASVADMAAAALTKANQTATDLEAESTRVDLILARMTGTTGALATQAEVSTVQTASVGRDNALGDRIDLVNVAVAGKASVDAMNVLSGEVDGLGNALGLAMTAVRAQQNGAGGNLCTNPTAEIDLSGWARGGEGASHAQTTLLRNQLPGYVLLPGTFSIFQNGNASAGYTDARYIDTRTTVEPGKRYCVQILTQAHRCTGIVYWGWANEDGTVQVGTWNQFAIPTHSLAYGNKLSEYMRLFSFGVAPAGAATLRIFVRKNPTLAGNADSYLFFSRVGINEVGADATAPPAWSGSSVGTESKLASAQSTLQAGIDAAGNALGLAITEVRARQGNGANLLKNPAMEADLSFWSRDNGTIGATFQCVQSTGQWTSGTNIYMPINTTGVRMMSASTTTPAGFAQLVSDPMAIDVTKKYIASVYANSFRNTSQLMIAYYRANGTWITEQVVSMPESGLTNPTMAQMPRYHLATANIPADARTARVLLRMRTTVVTDQPVTWFLWPMFEEVPTERTTPSEWSPGAGGIAQGLFQLKVGQDAQIVLMTNVNGKVSGMFSNNDGARSVIDFMSDVFRVSGSGANSTEIINGVTRSYSPTRQIISGPGFGVTGDLMFWIGPNVGINAASKQNGDIWFDGTSGYISGRLIVGNLHSSGRYNFTGLTVGTGTQGVLTHVGSSGRPKSVTYGFTYGTAGRSSFGSLPAANAYIASRTPNRTGTINIRIRRGATVIWSGSVTATSEVGAAEFIDTIPPSWQVGSSHYFSTTNTIQDNSTGTGDIVYTGEVTGSSGEFFANGGVHSISIVEQS